MAWNKKYWDILDQLYWWPRYLGMRSIAQKQWQMKDDLICVPTELVNETGPLYTREQKISDLMEDLHKREEILNHIFNLTFSIAPDSMIEDVLLKPLGFCDSGPFESLGRETSARYGWNRFENVTQHDGFFVSEKTAVGIELKLLSSSWQEQIAKYAALLAWEELHSGLRPQIGLLYIVPKAALKNHWGKCGLEGAKVDRTFLATKWKRSLPKKIQLLFDSHREHVASTLDRMKLGVITWDDLRHRMVTLQTSLDPSHRGDQTLERLIGGFITQLEAHRDTGLNCTER